MKRKDIIEFEIGSMEFGGESSTLIGKRKVKMKESYLFFMQLIG